jgi:DNA-binding NtrC family response regulator
MIPTQLHFSSNSTGLRNARLLKHIQLVGIEEEHRLLLAALFQAEGHLVSVSCTVKDALRLLQQGNINFVIVDHFAPELDGLSLLQEIKSLNPDIPVLILSSQYEMEHYMTAMNLGALDYFSKPVDYTSVQRIVNTHVTFRRNQPMNFMHSKALQKTSFRTLLRTLMTESQPAWSGGLPFWDMRSRIFPILSWNEIPLKSCQLRLSLLRPQTL